MKFCSNCGAHLVQRIPEGDDRTRYVCDSCRMIHYENPRMVVGCIPERDDRILMCRRAIEPCLGLWTLPAGYLESGETISDAAQREAWEETGSKVRILGLYSIFNLIRYDQIYMIFRADLLDDAFGPTDESLEVRLFGESEIPWDEIAFETIRQTLRLYVTDRARNHYPLHVGTIR